MGCFVCMSNGLAKGGSTTLSRLDVSGFRLMHVNSVQCTSLIEYICQLMKTHKVEMSWKFHSIVLYVITVD